MCIVSIVVSLAVAIGSRGYERVLLAGRNRGRIAYHRKGSGERSRWEKRSGVAGGLDPPIVERFEQKAGHIFCVRMVCVDRLDVVRRGCGGRVGGTWSIRGRGTRPFGRMSQELGRHAKQAYK